MRPVPRMLGANIGGDEKGRRKKGWLFNNSQTFDCNGCRHTALLVKGEIPRQVGENPEDNRISAAGD